jgi:DNA/RNA endonuclease G (NUC1)
MKQLKLAAVFVFAVLTAVSVFAVIDPALQAQLGNPSSALATPGNPSDTTNHAHFLILRPQYALDFSDNLGEPNWVSWDLTAADLGSSGRSPNFLPDPDLPIGFYAVVTSDYTGSGYDRGHMCPSADRTITASDNLNLFYLSNILPQAPDNNQGVWSSFETYCRTLAQAGNEVLITSGPSLFAGSRIPSGRAAIPGYVWKIAVVVPAGSGSALSRITASTRVIAIKIPNVQGVRSNPWQQYITSVAQIEADTGFTFFTALSPSLRNTLRTVVDGQTATGLPTLTTQPAGQSAAVGAGATFSVTATATTDTAFTYQWSKDDTEIPDATNAALTLTNVQAADIGNYTVVVTNSVGSVTSNPAALVITGLPPTIATQPVAKTVNAGATVTFSVAASGSPPLTFQWRKGGSNITGTPSATDATLQLTNVQAADAADYDVVVSNGVNPAATSTAVALTVTPAAPTITTQPVAQTTSVGSTATFKVVATGTTPLSYQWRKEGSNITGNASATTATLTLANVQNSDAANYDVVVSNDVNPAATSNAVTLTVSAASASSTIVWDFTTAAPASGLPSDMAGGTVTQGNNNGTTTLLTTTSASTPTTTFSGGSNAGAAARVGALNPAASGSAYFEFTLTPAAGKQFVATAISFGSRSTSTGPQAFDIYTSGDNFTAKVATGTFPNTSIWTLYSPTFTAVTSPTGTAITFRIYGYNGVGSPAAGTANWRIDDLKLTVNTVAAPPTAPAITSTLPAANATNASVTSPITITFNQAVNIGSGWFSINSAANGGLAATVTGGPTTYLLTPPANFVNGDTITVSLFAAQITDQATGLLHLTADSIFSFTIITPTAPSITTQPAGQTVSAGNTATFTVAASGTAPFSYQWRKDGTAINVATNASAGTATLTLTNVQAADAASYDVIVSNGVNPSAPSDAGTLSVTPAAPVITTQPVAQAAIVGGNVTFTVAARGTTPLSYQWRLGGALLADSGIVAGAATATLTLTGVALTDAGSYDVVVSNGIVPDATSNAAALTVAVAPQSIVTWDFTTADPTSGVPTGVTGGTVTQINNNGTTIMLTTTSASSGYAGATGTNNAGAAARVGALNPGASGSAYFEFTLTPPAGQQLVATTLGFGSRSTSTGPQAFSVFTSADSFTTAVASGALANDSGWRLTSPVLTKVSAAAGTATTFRIFGYNGAGSPAASTANWRIDDLKLGISLAIAPTVASTSLADSATGVALNAPITITFNQAVNVTGTWFSITSAAHGAVIATVSGGPTTFTLTPSSNLASNDTITVTVVAARVTEQATGTATLTSDYSFSFATAIAPSVTAQPQPQIAGVGDSVSFTVGTAGTGPLGYQWRKDGSILANGGNVSGATSATLTLTNAAPAAAGDYTVVVTNTAGSKTSDPAVLIIAHNADVNRDLRIGLIELTRVIELYNTRNGTARTGCYAVQAGSEDGFAPEPARANSTTVTLTRYHSADMDRNGQISLGELTRVIELYNYRVGTIRTGQYHVQADSEDGFAPGPTQ